MSPTLAAAFGRDTDGGQWTVSYLVDKIVANLALWCAESTPADDTLELLVALVEKKERCVVLDPSKTLF